MSNRASNYDTLCSVCVTNLYEYVIYGSSCVAVRDRKDGQWLEDHHAIDERIALVPTAYRGEHIGPWDLEIHSFGFQIHVGPVLAVTKPDAATQARLAHLVHHGSWLQRTAAIGLGMNEPG